MITSSSASIAAYAILLLSTYVTGFLSSSMSSNCIGLSTELAANCREGGIELNRRAAVHALLLPQAFLMFSQTKMASAVENTPTKPFAPNENLLPAVRVMISIEEAQYLTGTLARDINEETRTSTFQTLSDLFLQPQNYTKSLKLQGVPSKPADRYLDSYKSMDGDLPFQRYLVKSGDVSAWKNLKKEEKMKEKSDPVRAALNAYTDALTFAGDSYLLNVDRATRSNMLREDRLPDVKQVITSDMGMRYLYRNQVLTAIEDFRAELQYQSQHLDQTDSAEMVKLLDDASKALKRWLGLIDSNDVRLAVDTVRLEKNEIR